MTLQEQVRMAFGRHAGTYEQRASLQRAVAWRLARHCRELPLVAGPCADLGAGSGLLSRAVQQLRPSLQPLRLDLCAELLQQGARGGAESLLWDLNTGLPPRLENASLLVSSFALQWLERPQDQLEHWCRRLAPGGWLVLAVPTAGSFPQWLQAAAQARGPCSALPLPDAGTLVDGAQRHLTLTAQRRLRFSRFAPTALTFLRQIQALGAGSTPAAPLTPGQLRRLEAAWPAEPALSPSRRPRKRLTWEVLVLIGQRPAPSLRRQAGTVGP